MMRYAREHGHDPAGIREWVMLVAPAGEVEFFPYWIPEDLDVPFDRGWSDRTPLTNPPELLDD